MINKINGTLSNNTQIKKSAGVANSQSFRGKMILQSKSSVVEDGRPFLQVVNNIYDSIFVRTLGIFPEMEHSVVDKSLVSKISFDKKLDSKVKDLVESLNKDIKKLGLDKKMEAKYED